MPSAAYKQSPSHSSTALPLQPGDNAADGPKRLPLAKPWHSKSVSLSQTYEFDLDLKLPKLPPGSWDRHSTAYYCYGTALGAAAGTS